MVNSSLEHLEIKVPVDTGLLIGNTLRQYSMRGTSTWQIAAYKLGSKEGSFGLSGGNNFSYLELLSGKLVCASAMPPGTEILRRFDLVDGEYVCQDMKIINLGKIGVPSMEVCLVYSSGTRTADQNYASTKKVCSGDMRDYIAVPSKHIPTLHFRYEVRPFSLEEELLVVDATAGCVKLARDSAVKSLQGLGI